MVALRGDGLWGFRKTPGFRQKQTWALILLLFISHVVWDPYPLWTPVLQDYLERMYVHIQAYSRHPVNGNYYKKFPNLSEFNFLNWNGLSFVFLFLFSWKLLLPWFLVISSKVIFNFLILKDFFPTVPGCCLHAISCQWMFVGWMSWWMLTWKVHSPHYSSPSSTMELSTVLSRSTESSQNQGVQSEFKTWIWIV